MRDELELGAVAEGLGLISEDRGPEVFSDRASYPAPDPDGAVYLGAADYAKTDIPLLAGFAPPGPWSSVINVEGDVPSGGPVGVVGAEDRKFVNDRRLPWCAVGQIGWAGAGVLIGPRHVLTATHVLDWTPKAPGSGSPFGYRYVPGSKSFRAGFYTGPNPDGPPAPFGDVRIDAVVTGVPWEDNDIGHGVSDPSGNPVSFARPLDVAVCILSERVGERAGWFGFSGWTHDWNGQSHFSHIGYPMITHAPAHGVRPTVQGPISKASIIKPETRAFRINGAPPINASVLWHDFDLQSGNSGGPIFGWFGNERMPRVVGVASARGDGVASLNAAAGGMQMLRTIHKALTLFP